MRLDYIPVEPARRPRSARRNLLIAALGVCVTTLLFTSRPGVAKRHEQPVVAAPPVVAGAAAEALPESEDYEALISAAVTDELAVPAVSDWTRVEVRPGQTLSGIFDGLGLAPTEWMPLTKLPVAGAELKKLKAGDALQIRAEADRLEELKFDISETRTLHVRRNGEAFEAAIVEAQLERRPAYKFGVVTSSLYASAQRSGLSNRLIMDVAEILGYDIDFALDIREGDRFTVVYEELYKDGEKVRDGDVLAVEFVNQGRVVRAVRHDTDGRIAYYTPEGQSLRKAFIRTPLDVFRISSHFNPSRRHPILNTIRAHKGTDYAAPQGTPIKSTGDGRVVFIGNKSGYGKVIIVKHGSQYETLYAHMSRFRAGLRVGSRVAQGQVIGYVGKTGLATAPHLHFEFHVNGVHKNPVTVPLPRANPVARQDLPRFRAEVSPLIAQLDTLARTLAAAGASPTDRAAP